MRIFALAGGMPSSDFLLTCCCLYPILPLGILLIYVALTRSKFLGCLSGIIRCWCALLSDALRNLQFRTCRRWRRHLRTGWCTTCSGVSRQVCGSGRIIASLGAYGANLSVAASSKKQSCSSDHSTELGAMCVVVEHDGPAHSSHPLVFLLSLPRFAVADCCGIEGILLIPKRLLSLN